MGRVQHSHRTELLEGKLLEDQDALTIARVVQRRLLHVREPDDVIDVRVAEHRHIALVLLGARQGREDVRERVPDPANEQSLTVQVVGERLGIALEPAYPEHALTQDSSGIVEHAQAIQILPPEVPGPPEASIVEDERDARLAVSGRNYDLSVHGARVVLERVGRDLEHQVADTSAVTAVPPLQVRLELRSGAVDCNGRHGRRAQRALRPHREVHVLPKTEREYGVPRERKPVPVMQQVALHVLAVLLVRAENGRRLEEHLAVIDSPRTRHRDDELVRRAGGRQLGRHIELEAREHALVVAAMPAVEVHVAEVVRGLELEEHAVVATALWRDDLADVQPLVVVDRRAAPARPARGSRSRAGPGCSPVRPRRRGRPPQPGRETSDRPPGAAASAANATAGR